MVDINILYICTGSDINSIISPMNKTLEKIMEYSIQKTHYHAQLFSFSLPKIFAKIKQYYAVYQQRQELRHLTDEQLSDIGISREQATHEANKPFWE